MKNWRYFYLFVWLILISAVVNGWALKVGLLPKSFWNFLYEIYGSTNIEDSTDWEYLVTYLMSFAIVCVLVLPGFILWNRKFPYKEPADWFSHPVVRMLRITLITAISFLVIFFLYVIFECVLFRYDTRTALGSYLDIPVRIIVIFTSIAVGNCYRKMSLK